MKNFHDSSRILALALGLGIVLLFWPARPLRSDNFVFYLPNSRQVVPIQAVKGTDYLPLLQVLNTLGKVAGLQESRKSLKVWFGATELEFRPGDKIVQVDKRAIALKDPARVEKGQWLVPLDFLYSVLPLITHQTIEYRAGAHRIFVGDLRPSSFTVRLNQLSNGARLTIQFTDKVSVRTSASNGKWYVLLAERPVEPLEPNFHFQNPFVSELQFDDHDGNPKLIVTPGKEGLNFYPQLDPEGKVLTADVVQAGPAVAQQPPVPQGPTPPPAPSTPGEGLTPSAGGPALPAIALDAGHGGEDSGAHDKNGLTEKDIVALLVANTRTALLSTRKYRVVLTRVGDLNPTLDQRDIIANTARAQVFLTFHAGDLGLKSPRVAVYNYQAPSLDEDPPEVKAGRLLVPWNVVQEMHRARSRELAQTLTQHLSGVAAVSASLPRSAPVRVLRSVNAPAAAIEIGNLSPDADSTSLTSPEFLQQVSSAIVQALQTFEGRQP